VVVNLIQFVRLLLIQQLVVDIVIQLMPHKDLLVKVITTQLQVEVLGHLLVQAIVIQYVVVVQQLLMVRITLLQGDLGHQLGLVLTILVVIHITHLLVVIQTALLMDINQQLLMDIKIL